MYNGDIKVRLVAAAVVFLIMAWGSYRLNEQIDDFMERGGSIFEVGVLDAR